MVELDTLAGFVMLEVIAFGDGTVSSLSGSLGRFYFDVYPRSTRVPTPNMAGFEISKIDVGRAVEILVKRGLVEVVATLVKAVPWRRGGKTRWNVIYSTEKGLDKVRRASSLIKHINSLICVPYSTVSEVSDMWATWPT